MEKDMPDIPVLQPITAKVAQLTAPEFARPAARLRCNGACPLCCGSNEIQIRQATGRGE